MEVELPVSDNVILSGHGTINLDLPINEEMDLYVQTMSK